MMGPGPALRLTGIKPGPMDTAFSIILAMGTPTALIVLADDLSGAADCAASFTGDGGSVRLLFDPGDLPSQARVAVDCDSRWRGADEAARTWRDIARAIDPAANHLYKKIDSTLRGHIAVELGAMLDVLPRRDVVVAPAFPAQGRALVQGRLFLHGRDAHPMAQDLGETLLQALGPRADVTQLSMAELMSPDLGTRLGALSARPRIWVADAGEDAHLEALATALRALERKPLLVGSAGLARAMAGAPPRHVELHREAGPVFMIVGSFSDAARRQVAAFALHRGDRSIAVEPGQHKLQDAAARAARALRRGDDVLVHLAFTDAASDGGSRSLVQALAGAMAPLARDCGTLVLTGGDTARAVLDALGVRALEIEGEAQPGVPVTAPFEAGGPKVVLKAGGFGHNDFFARLARGPLRSISSPQGSREP
jgi:uncharacterized protein YgbK (DUF1537 family)